MRDHHPGRGAGQRVPSQGNVEEPERHHPQHLRRSHLPRADHLQERAASGPELDPADHHRPPRLRRPVPRDRFQGSRKRPPHHPVRGRRRDGDREGSVQVPGRRHCAVDVQSRRFDPRLRPRVAELRVAAQVPRLSLDQEHDSEGLRRPLQGHLPGGLRRRVQEPVPVARHHLRASPDRRHGRGRAQVVGRLRVGLQELRRRRAVRHGRAGVRFARPHDQRAR